MDWVLHEFSRDPDGASPELAAVARNIMNAVAVALEADDDDGLSGHARVPPRDLPAAALRVHLACCWRLVAILLMLVHSGVFF